MGWKCFVPSCTSGYKTNKEKLSLFRAPKDNDLLIQWNKVIPRKDRTLTRNDHVCEKHFDPQDIVKEWSCAGNTFPLKPHRLKKDAVPKFFPNCPKYRNIASKKRRIITKHDVIDKKLKTDDDLSTGVSSKQNESAVDNSANPNIFDIIWNSSLKLPGDTWSFLKICGEERQISFGKFTSCDRGIPCAERQVLIKENMNSKYIFHNIVIEQHTLPNIFKTIEELENILMVIDSLKLYVFVDGDASLGKKVTF